jgi:O-antigen ligase
MATAHTIRRTLPLTLRRAATFEQSAQYRITCWALLLWWIASFYPVVSLGDVSESLAGASQSTSQGSLFNQLLVLSFAALGSLYLPRAYRELQTRVQGRTALLLLSIYLLWAGASIIWSIDRALTFRRVAETTLIFIGAIGLGAGFYARTREHCLTLARHVLYANIVAFVVLVGIAGSKGYFAELFNPEWTLKAETMVSYFVFPAAYGIVSALVLFSTARAKRVAIVLSLGLILVLMKSRTALAGLVAVALLIYSQLAARGLRRNVAYVFALMLLAVQLDLAMGGHLTVSSVTIIANSFPSALPYVSIGNGLEDLLTLDGHVPLWHALWPIFRQHAALGQGFGAFWNPPQFDAIQAEVSWPAVAAHNGFLEELLGTGIVGLVLFLAFWFYGMHASWQRARIDRRAGWLVLGWLLLFLTSNTMGSVMQFYFQDPTLFAVTALFALLVQDRSYAVRRRPAASSRELEVLGKP